MPPVDGSSPPPTSAPVLPAVPASPAGHHGVRRSGFSRRTFIQTMGLSAAGAAMGSRVEQALAGSEQQATNQALGPNPFAITLRINGQDLKATIEPGTTLMETLRWHLDLTGTKEVCDRGSCGACSVLLDGELINSCMLLAVDAIGSEITTVEGLAKDGQLDALQEAFCRHDALQCGYCTPGLVMASKAVLNAHRSPTLEQIKHGLSGNICRCGTYTNVFNAVLEASGQKPIMDSGMDGGDA